MKFGTQKLETLGYLMVQTEWF